MKKIAIVGASNSFIANGYGRILKASYPDDVDIFSFGDSSSLLGVFQLLTFDIVNKYKFVVFHYNMSETQHTFYGTFNKEYLVSYLAGMVAIFKGSKSIPVFLLCPYLYLCRYESVNYIYKAISSLYDIPVIDMDRYLAKFNDDKLINFDDRAHFSPKFQAIIAQRLLEYLDTLNVSYAYGCSNEIENLPQFSLLPKESFGNAPQVIKGTSWKKLSVFLLNMESFISIPDGFWLCGIFYWTADGRAPYISIKSESSHITKNINLLSKNSFSCRSIAYSCLGGAPGGVLSLVNSRLNTIEELTGTEDIDSSHDKNELFVVSLLLCNQNPWLFGHNFINKYKNRFALYKREMIVESVKLLQNSCNLF